MQIIVKELIVLVLITKIDNEVMVISLGSIALFELYWAVVSMDPFGVRFWMPNLASYSFHLFY